MSTSEARKRTLVVGVRFSSEEHKDLSVVAEIDEVSVPELLRRLWFAELKRRQELWLATVREMRP